MKPAEIRDLKLDEAKAKAAELTKELFNLRMRHATNQLENPLKLRLLKREIARIKTVVAEKERVK
ncbi:50S ribosomal protein L29 [uncultured bacterium]|jgi:large subunit ribosomal protein L29|nr:50S ribosomal protein L29 [uncultured bacterium]